MIRGYQPTDLARLHQLDQLCFSPEIAYSRLELQSFLVDPDCACWIVEQADKRLDAFIILERVSWNGHPAGHIVTLDVDPTERRRGLGRLLMQTAEAQMKREGAATLSLEVAKDNIAARHFYRSLGFRVSGKIANYYGGRIDAEVMRKVIGSD